MNREKVKKFLIDKRMDLAIFFFFILIFVLAHSFGWFDVSTPLYIDGITQGARDVFTFPLFFWIGVAGFSVFGETFFVAFPFILMLLTVYSIIKTFDLFGLRKEIILFSFLITSKWIPRLCFFNRDGLAYFLAAIFSYLFFRIMYKKETKLLAYQSFIVLLLLATKVAGNFFLIIFIFELLYLYHRHIANFIPGLFVGFVRDVETIWLNTYNHFIEGPKILPNITFLAMLSAAGNPVFAISSFLFIKRKDMVHLVVIVLTLFIFGGLVAMDNHIGRVLRYTALLMPLHICFIGMALKDYDRSNLAKIVLFFLAAKFISGFFYLDAVWKIILKNFAEIEFLLDF